MNRFRFLLTVFLLPALLVACGDDNGPTLDPEDYVGSYTLETVDGSELPANVVLEGANIQINSAIASLDHDRDWGLRFNGQIGGATTELEFAGTYSIAGNKLTLRVMDEDHNNVIRTLKGTIQIEAETLTIEYNGTILVFRFGVPA